MWALENKHIDIAKLLLKYKPQVRIQDTVILLLMAGYNVTLCVYREGGLRWCWPLEQETWR